MSARKHPQAELLLCLLDQAYVRKAWHGPNLRGALRGLTPRQAAWKPAGCRHSIWEIALHAAYWKYAVRRRLAGDRRGGFPLAGSNWFALPRPASGEAWRAALRLLEAEHRALRAAAAAFPAARLDYPAAGSRYTAAELIWGAAAHDVYHAGQIQLLKRLLPR